MAETGIVDRFEQAGTETAVHAHRQACPRAGQRPDPRADDRVREVAAVGEAGGMGRGVRSIGLMER